MFKPADPKSLKYLSTFQKTSEINTRSLNTSNGLRGTASGPVKIRWNLRTGDSPSARGNGITPGKVTAREIADQFLTEHRELFGIPEETFDSPVVQIRERRGIRHVTYRQQYEGLPVVGSAITVHIDQASRVQMVNGTYCPKVEVEASRALISETAAIEAVLKALETKEYPETHTKRVVFPQGNRHIQAYKVSLRTRRPLGDWVYFVNASTGEVIDGYNAMRFVKGNGNIYNTNSVRDPSVATGELFDLDETGTLSGTYFKIENDAENTANATPTGPGPYDFLYSDPADPHFDEIMVYYHLNRIAGFYRELGHTAHDTQMSAYVHVPDPLTENPDYDDAFFSPFDHAVYFGHGATLNDLAQEAAIIYHEYAHSVVHTIQPFMGTYEAGALHEGYADYFGCSLTEDPKIGEFVVEQIGKDYWRDLRSPKTYSDLSGTDAHTDGEIWGSTCWKIREALGRRIADQLMYESLEYLPENATFVDACDGILQADTDLFNGEHLSELEKIFTEKEIGAAPPLTYSIVASAGRGGSILPSGEVMIKQGEAQTFSITADIDYRITHVLVDGTTVGAVTEYTFENVTADHTIEACFEEDQPLVTHKIVATAEQGGSISPSGDVMVKQGEDQLFTISPDTDHIVQHVLVDGASVGAVLEYRFEDVRADHTIEACFEEPQPQEYTVIVPGEKAWTDSGIIVQVDQKISITAYGTVFYHPKRNDWCCGPGGESWTDTADRRDPLWQEPHAGLIGRIGKDNTPFFIGESYTHSAENNGALYLGINDGDCPGNRGKFTVTIRLS